MILKVADVIPGIGIEEVIESEEWKEIQEEQERLRQESIEQSEVERRIRYKKQEEDRESMRQIIRDKADTLEWDVVDPTTFISIHFMIWNC